MDCNFFTTLIAEIRDGGTRAITLAGSHARGDATPYSDVDIIHYVDTPKTAEADYVLRIIEGRLVSITRRTIAQAQAELARPQSAVWIVPAIRQQKCLLDLHGQFAELQAQAVHFVWGAEMRQQADAFASEELMGFPEEAHKILSGLFKNHDSTILMGALGMQMGMGNLMLVQRGLLVESENDYFQRLHDAIGGEWSVWWGRLTRFSDPAVCSARMCGLAALKLYLETIDLIQAIIEPQHRIIIDHAAEQVRQSHYLDALDS